MMALINWECGHIRNDAGRNAAFAAAVAAAVAAAADRSARGGGGSSRRGPKVVEIGAGGTALLSMYAAAAGAR